MSQIWNVCVAKLKALSGTGPGSLLLWKQGLGYASCESPHETIVTPYAMSSASVVSVLPGSACCAPQPLMT